MEAEAGRKRKESDEDQAAADGKRCKEREAQQAATGDGQEGTGEDQKEEADVSSISGSSIADSLSAELARRLASPTQRDAALPKVSVIIPCHNAMPWLDDCLKSCCVQDYNGPVEISVYNDNSSDGSLECIKSWEGTMTALGIGLVHSTHSSPHQDAAERAQSSAETKSARPGAGGAGRARNEAIKQSSGEYLCFLDADDVMLPTRISRQLEAARANPDAIVGGGFVREPAGATAHYSQWANTMDSQQLILEQFREITVILPTWFFSRALFERVGGFEEASPEQEGEAEDLTYFHRHLSLHQRSSSPSSASLVRVGDASCPVLMYRFLASSSSWRTPRRKLLRIRVQAFEERVLDRQRAVWERFTVWGAGRDSRQFISELSEEAAARVRAMCDVDESKIGKEYFNHRSKNPNPPRIPIIHYKEAEGPVVVCVSKRRFSDDLDAELLKNVSTLGLTEGHNLWFFI